MPPAAISHTIRVQKRAEVPYQDGWFHMTQGLEPGAHTGRCTSTAHSHWDCQNGIGALAIRTGKMIHKWCGFHIDAEKNRRRTILNQPNVGIWAGWNMPCVFTDWQVEMNPLIQSLNRQTRWCFRTAQLSRENTNLELSILSYQSLIPSVSGIHHIRLIDG